MSSCGGFQITSSNFQLRALGKEPLEECEYISKYTGAHALSESNGLAYGHKGR
jgi:hypothetical protein